MGQRPINMGKLFFTNPLIFLILSARKLRMSKKHKVIKKAPPYLQDSFCDSFICINKSFFFNDFPYNCQLFCTNFNKILPFY
jgi:hypothetical protein